MALKRLLTAPLVTFDAFHTLYEARESASHQYISVVKKYGINADEERIEKALKSAFKQIDSEYPLYGKNSNISVRQWWKKVILKTFEPEVISDRIFDAIYEHFNTPHAYTVYEDSKYMIEMLEKYNVPIGVITNTDPAVKSVLKELGYNRLSTNCFTSYDTGYEKPDINSFLEAAKRVGLTNNKSIWHVGDDPETDMRGAIKVGWNTILIDRQKVNSNIKTELKELNAQKKGKMEYDDDEIMVLEDCNGLYRVYTEDLRYLKRLGEI